MFGTDHFGQTRPHAVDQGGIVDQDGIADRARDLRLGRSAVRCRRVLGDAAQFVEDLLAHGGIVTADGADEFHLLRHDVLAIAALDDAETEHRRLQRDVQATTDDALRIRDDGGGGDDGVHAQPRPSAVRLLALHDDAESVGGRHHRAGARADLADVRARIHMQAEHRFRLEAIEQAFGQHLRRATGFAGGRAFFGRLEDEHHFAGKIAAHRGQRLRDAHQDGGMRIMAAGVHHADGLAVVLRRDFRSEGQAGLFGHRQRVHVGAQGDARPGLAAFQYGDDAGMRDAGAHLQSERAQMRGDEFRGAEFAIAELGILVQVATPGHDLVLHGRRQGGGMIFAGGRGGRKQEQAAGEQGAHGVDPVVAFRYYNAVPSGAGRKPLRRSGMPAIRGGRGA